MNATLQLETPEHAQQFLSPAALEGREAIFSKAEACEEKLSEVASVKRFLERYLGDAGFRSSLHKVFESGGDLHAVLAASNLRVHPEDVRAYLRMNKAHSGKNGETPALRHYREFTMAGAQDAATINARAERGASRAYAAWRQRQMGALRFHFSAFADLVVHPVAAYELSRGCSVGCWFCAVGAEKLQGHFLANHENLALFRTAQQAMRRLLGEAAGAAMCYWATDALDNPDYEIFAAEFCAEHGVFPPTTTAIGWKNPERTRALLHASAEAGTHLNRFSVLSVGMLNRLHAAFSEEELLRTELVFQMPEALVPIDVLSNAPARKIRAGRARSLPADQRVYDDGAGTVACVIGFLVNFVERTIRLIAPTLPSETWPLGYRTLAQVQGFTEESFSSAIEGMIREHMQPGFGEEPLRLHELLETQIVPEGLRVQSAKHAVTLSAWGLSTEALRFCIDLLRSGTQNASDISLALRRAGVSLLHSQAFLQRLRAEGIFDLA